MGIVVSLWGKGGVGKSSLAAGLALRYARMGLRTILVSTDPFPSILDLLGVGGEPGERVEACGFHLISVSRSLASRLWRERFGDEVYRVFSLVFDVDRETLLSYLEEAPWVLEQMHLYLVLEASRSHDVVVWDTAGAGGGLQALELEEHLYRHLRLAPRIYSRLRGSVAGVDRVIGEWRRLAEEILGFIRSPSHHPVIVGDAQLGAWHVVEAYEYIARYREPSAIVLNRFVERDECNGCLYTREALRASRETLKGVKARLRAPIYTVPWLPRQPRGCEGAERLAELLAPLAEALLRG